MEPDADLKAILLSLLQQRFQCTLKLFREGDGPSVGSLCPDAVPRCWCFRRLIFSRPNVIQKRPHESSTLWHELCRIRGKSLIRELMSEIGEALASWEMCAQNAVDQ